MHASCQHAEECGTSKSYATRENSQANVPSRVLPQTEHAQEDGEERYTDAPGVQVKEPLGVKEDDNTN